LHPNTEQKQEHTVDRELITTLAMATKKLLALLALLTLSAGALAHHGHGHGHKQHSPPPAAPSPAAAALVRTTCSSTTYYDVCVSALGADPASATADVRGLSSIAVSAAAANASGGAATAATLANGTSTEQGQADAAVTQALLRTCAAKYGQARSALRAAGGSIAEQDYDYATVHVSAAAEYPQVCKVLFHRRRPGAYPAELAAREEALSKLCTVSLDIIALLSSQS
jgi:pectinesterase inhibitor-like protein